MNLRIGLVARSMRTLAVASAIGWAAPAFAQTGAEYPRTMGGYRGPSIGSGSINLPRPSGSGASRTTEISDAPDAPPIISSHPPRTIKQVPEDNSAIDLWQGRLRIAKNSYAYELPTISSTRIAPVTAGSYVDVIGASRYYAQVKLSNSEIAYIPLAAIVLVNPTDKTLRLNSDSAVLNAPNQWGSKIGVLHSGYNVHVVGMAPNYMKIRMGDGREGYIHSLE